MKPSHSFILKFTVLCALLLAAVAFLVFLPSIKRSLSAESLALKPQYTVNSETYSQKDYLIGCILYSLAGLDRAPDEDCRSGINAVAAAIKASVIYLDGTGTVNHGGFFSVGFMDTDEAQFYYGDDYENYLSYAKAAAEYALGTDILYDGQSVFLPVCRISSVTLISPEESGRNLPYLKKLYCPADENALKYSGRCQLTCDGIAEKLLLTYPHLILPPDREDWITDIVADSGGNILSLSCCGISMSGYEFAELFSLRSVNFDVDFSQNVYSFTTRGYGNSTGMSVYAAVKLSERGFGEKEILECFYKDLYFSGI